MRKTFQELDLKDAFLFSAALQDEETCRLILEIILDEPIRKVSVHAENTLLFSSDFRSLRLDIYASDEMWVEYNLEMQNENRHNLAKRSRFHQAQMDITSLKPGEDFQALRPSYVVFICTFDPFGQGLYRYTFENRCIERGFPLDDGTKKIFLNTRGTNSGEVPGLLADFLHYVENTTDTFVQSIPDSREIQFIHQKILDLKESREWERRYMTFEELMRESMEKGIEEGLEKGLKEGQNRILTLTSCMIQAGETASIPLLQQDPAFLEEMLVKYHL